MSTIGFPGAERAEQYWTRRVETPQYSERGMVATAHPLATAAGLDVLRNGGNAVDAAIAAAAVAAVTMPEMCGLGGDIFAIVSKPGQAPVSYLGSGIAPRGATVEQMKAAGAEGGTKMPYQGPLSIGVPGMVDGYFKMLGDFGTRSFADLAQYAIGHASDGYQLTPMGASYINFNAELLKQYPGSRSVFFPYEKTWSEGELFKQTDLGLTLQTIANEGPDSFYRGDLARRIAQGVQDVGGALSAEDLADHATVITPPIQTTYRDHTIYQTGLPSQGLIHLIEHNIVEAYGDLAEGAEGMHVLVEAKKLAYADRLAYAVDPNFGDTPMHTLLSKEWAAKRATWINPGRASTEALAGGLQDGDTTYLCVVDGEGMMVSLIQSVSSSFGSCVVAGDTGVVMNNRVGRGFSLVEGHVNYFAPGKRTMHTLNCFMIAAADGTMVVTGGTPGGDGQPQWNLQMATGMIDFGWDVQGAIEAPRWTSWPGTDPGSLPNPFDLRIESRVKETELFKLEEKGHRVIRQGPWEGGGAAQIIARDPKTGVLAGGSDPRAEGHAAGL
jgi:gamma-glutamyltranspeptidase/glutathione hydrolase